MQQKNIVTFPIFENDALKATFYCEYYNEENISIPVKYTLLVFENSNLKYIKDILPYAYEEIVKEYENKFLQLTSPVLN